MEHIKTLVPDEVSTTTYGVGLGKFCKCNGVVKEDNWKHYELGFVMNLIILYSTGSGLPKTVAISIVQVVTCPFDHTRSFIAKC